MLCAWVCMYVCTFPNLGRGVPQDVVLSRSSPLLAVTARIRTRKKKKGTHTRQSFCVFQKIRPRGRARSCQRAMISPPSPPPLLFVFPGMECDCDFPGQNLSACTSDASMASSIRRRSCREEDPGKGAPSLRRPPPPFGHRSHLRSCTRPEARYVYYVSATLVCIFLPVMTARRWWWKGGDLCERTSGVDGGEMYV